MSSALWAPKRPARPSPCYTSRVQSPTAAWLIKCWPRDDSGAEVPTYVGTHKFLSAGTDDPANTHFLPYLAEPPGVSFSLFEGEELGGFADVGGGSFIFRNPLSDSGLGPLEALRLLHWNGARYEAYWADAKPTPPKALTAYTKAFAGRFESMTAELDSLILAVRSRRLVLDQDVGVPTFRGTGPRCVRAVAANSASCGNVFNNTGSFSFRILVKPIFLTTLNQKFMWKFNSGSSTGFGLEVSQSAGLEGRMRFRIGGLTPVNLATGAADALTLGTEFYEIVCVYDAATPARRIYIDKKLVVSDAPTGTRTTNSDNFLLYSGAEADVVDFTLWDGVVLSDDDVAQLGRGPVEPNEAGATNYWPITDSSGSTITDTKGSPARNATMTGGSWVSSLEGSQDLTGQPKPIALGGTIWTAEPVEVNRVDRDHMYHHRGARSIGTVRSKGGPLVVTTNYTSSLTTGTIRIVLDPTEPGVVTLDITGGDEGTAAFGYDATTIPDFMRYLLTAIGPLEDSDLYYDGTDDPFGVAKGSTFENLAPCAYYLRQGGNLLEEIAKLARSVGAAVFFDPTRDDRLFLFRPDIPTGATDLDLDWSTDFGPLRFVDDIPPTASQRVSWQTCHRPMTTAELLSLDTGLGATAALGAAFRSFVTPKKLPRRQVVGDRIVTEYVDAPYRLAEIRAKASTLKAYPEAVPGDVVESYFTTYRDAVAEAKRRQNGWFGTNGVIGVVLPLVRVISGLALGKKVTVIDPKLNDGAGRKMIVTRLDWTAGPYGEVTCHG